MKECFQDLQFLDRNGFFINQVQYFQMFCRRLVLRFICFRLERRGDLNAHQLVMTPVFVGVCDLEKLLGIVSVDANDESFEDVQRMDDRGSLAARRFPQMVLL